MGSVLNALIGLAGLVCSGALAIGLVANPSARATPAEAGFIARVADGAASPDAPIGDEPYAAEDDARGGVAEMPPAAGPETGETVLYRVCRVTAYCDRGTTASGVPSGMGHCAAPEDVPFGSIVHIPALGKSFVVTDRTHRRFRRSTVDIFMPSAKQCRYFGRRYLECEITLLPAGAARSGRR